VLWRDSHEPCPCLFIPTSAASIVSLPTEIKQQRVNRCKYDPRKYCFTNEVILVNTQRSLPNYVVSANTTNSFENRPDNFWQTDEKTLQHKFTEFKVTECCNYKFYCIWLTMKIIYWRGGPRGK